MRNAGTLSLSEVKHTWSDFEFWGPLGRGCSHCTEGLPAIETSFGKLCLGCLGTWFPTKSQEWIIGWLVRQREALHLLARTTPRKRPIQLHLWPR